MSHSEGHPECPTGRDTQRGSQSYMEKREEGDRGNQEEKRWDQKERDRYSL